MIAFKRTASLDEWAALHSTLRDVLFWVHSNVWPDDIMVITRIFDPPVKGEVGTHRDTPHRAADIRTNTLPDVQVRAIEKQINAHWAYGDPTKPERGVALFHTISGGAPHLHIQVRKTGETRPRVPVTDV